MNQSHGLMSGKRGLVMGVANDRSIAWGISKALAAQGAELAFTYQGEALEKRVRPLAEQVGAKKVVAADVTDAASLDAAFAELARNPTAKTVIVPAEMSGLVGTIAGLGELVGLAKEQQQGRSDVRRDAPSPPPAPARTTPPRPPRPSVPST